MPADEDLLFGKIAVTRGFCTQEQIDECVRMQSFDNSPPGIGDLLLFKNYLTPEQHREVLKLQLERMQAEDPMGKLPKESILFGKLAVREKVMTQEQANECLREQAKPGESYWWGTWYEEPHPDGGIAWTNQSMPLPILFK